MIPKAQGMKNYQFRIKKKGRRILRSLRRQSLGLKRYYWIFFTLILFLSVVIGIGYILFHLPLFQVKEVRISGCLRIPEELIEEIADVKGKNILFINLNQVGMKIKEEEWIERVIIKKMLPDRIDILVKERVAQALINLERLYLVDQNGVIFRKVKKNEHFDLPVLTGLTCEFFRRNPKSSHQLICQALAILSIIDSKMGFSREDISEIHIDPVVGFSIFDVKNATQIKLGFTDFYEKLERFKMLGEIMRKEGSPKIIDLRYQDKVLVTWDNLPDRSKINKEVKRNG